MEEDQNSEVVEVTPQDQESNVVESSEAPEETPEVQDPHEVEDKQERNWKESRRKQRELETTNKTQKDLIDKLLEARQAPNTAPQVPEPDEFANIAPDDYLTKVQTDKRIEKQAEAIAERKYREMEVKREQARFVERLKSKYADFTDVVNPDSIALLEEKEPELAQTIADLKDPYKMGLQTYHYLKGGNFSEDVSDRRHAKEVEKKIEQNEKTVQSPQAYNKRPMAQAFQNSGENDSKLYEEMMGYARQAGSGY